ncbi:MAG: hypothetical protein GY694_03340 [Gammaproteobacteria bacterium]|nr:hypothetical protein [Gammaproteobacteria bacterium]
MTPINIYEGRRKYSRRMWTIEPVFGNICSNKGLNRISLRGKSKATAQYPKRFTGQALPKAFHGAGSTQSVSRGRLWLLYCMVHNIEKLWKNSEIPQWG